MKKFFDNICSCCHSAQTSGFSQSSGCLSVLCSHISDRIFHCSKKCGFCKPCWWPGLSCIQSDTLDLQLLTLTVNRKLLIFQFFFFCIILVLIIAFIDFLPSGTDNCLSTCHKSTASCFGFQRSLLIHIRRIKNS